MGGDYGYLHTTAGAPQKTLKQFSGKAKRPGTTTAARVHAPKTKGKRYYGKKKNPGY